MTIPTLADLIPVLQVAIGPVILISGAGLVLLSMTNRIGRAIDRARLLKQELHGQPPEAQRNMHAQLSILAHRAHLLRQAIILLCVSILLAALLIISLFLAALLRWEAGWLILVLFVGCLAALIAAMVPFIEDVNQSLKALELDLSTDD